MASNEDFGPSKDWYPDSYYRSMLEIYQLVDPNWTRELHNRVWTNHAQSLISLYGDTFNTPWVVYATDKFMWSFLRIDGDAFEEPVPFPGVWNGPPHPAIHTVSRPPPPPPPSSTSYETNAFGGNGSNNPQLMPSHNPDLQAEIQYLNGELAKEQLLREKMKADFDKEVHDLKVKLRNTTAELVAVQERESNKNPVAPTPPDTEINPRTAFNQVRGDFDLSKIKPRKSG